MKLIRLITALLSFGIMAHAQVQQGGPLYVPSAGGPILGTTTVTMTNAACNVLSPGATCTLTAPGAAAARPWYLNQNLTGTCGGSSSITYPLGQHYIFSNSCGSAVTMGGATGATVSIPGGVENYEVNSPDGANYYAVGTITAVTGTAPVVATPSGSTVDISLPNAVTGPGSGATVGNLMSQGNTSGTSALDSGIAETDLALLDSANRFTSPQLFYGGGYLPELATATSGVNYNSNVLNLLGSYWAGFAPTSDGWTIQDVVGTGSTPSSTLTIAHQATGGVPTGKVALPATTISNGISQQSPCLADGTGGGVCVPASGNVASATYALNTQCYGAGCPNDNQWQAPWPTGLTMSLATGYPLGSSDTSAVVNCVSGILAKGAVVTTAEEEIIFTGLSVNTPSTGLCTLTGLQRGVHGTIPVAVPVVRGNMNEVVSETSSCSSCAVITQWSNQPQFATGSQTNPGIGASLYTYGNVYFNAGYVRVPFNSTLELDALPSSDGLATDVYGHVTAQTAANLASILGLTYVSPSFVKMTAAGTFALDTNTYLTSLSGALLATGATTGATTQAQTFTDGVIPSNLTVGYIPYAESTDKKLVNSPVYTDGTNVGIGTTSPGANLELSGNGSAPSANTPTFRVGDSVTTVAVLDFGLDMSNSNGWIQARNKSSGIYNTLLLNPLGGNVSIGTANQFQVSSTGVASMAAGSTVNSTAICLADGTNCPAFGGSLSCSNLAFGPGAGTSPTCISVNGVDGTHQVQINTGTLPTPTNILYTLTFTATRGHNTYCSFSPADSNSTTFSATAQAYVSGGSATSYYIFANGTAPATSQLTYNVNCP